MSLLLLDDFTSPAAPPAPVVPAVIPFVSAFAARVAATDRRVLELLGGAPVIYQPAEGDPVEVSGVFDQVYVLSRGTAEAGVEALGPAVFLLLEDLPVDPELDEPTLTIGGLVYRVHERRPDGLGGIVLALRLVV